jgi:hypothetical protein
MKSKTLLEIAIRAEDLFIQKRESNLENHFGALGKKCSELWREITIGTLVKQSEATSSDLGKWA